MFGTVRPFQDELKLREMTQYRAAYCGLCHTLSERYGMLARLLVNYDFVLPALLYWREPCPHRKKRCARHPFRKQCCAAGDPSLAYAADTLMIFSDWKLRDTVRDEKGLKRIFARFMRLLYRRQFRKASELRPDEAAECARRMDELWKLEREHSQDLLAVSSAFGSMLSCLAGYCQSEPERRAAGSLFFHLGRWIYAADAVEDYPRDKKKKNYNPLTERGGIESARVLMADDHTALAAAFDLLPANAFTNITGNILTLGLEARGHRLFSPPGSGGEGCSVIERSV